jgi:hypothetical protein
MAPVEALGSLGRSGDFRVQRESWSATAPGRVFLVGPNDGNSLAGTAMQLIRGYDAVRRQELDIAAVHEDDRSTLIAALARSMREDPGQMAMVISADQELAALMDTQDTVREFGLDTSIVVIDSDNRRLMEKIRSHTVSGDRAFHTSEIDPQNGMKLRRFTSEVGRQLTPAMAEIASEDAAVAFASRVSHLPSSVEPIVFLNSRDASLSGGMAIFEAVTTDLRRVAPVAGVNRPELAATITDQLAVARHGFIFISRDGKTEGNLDLLERSLNEREALRSMFVLDNEPGVLDVARGLFGQGGGAHVIDMRQPGYSLAGALSGIFTARAK